MAKKNQHLWDIVVRAYELFGIKVNLDIACLPCGYVYKDKEVALGYDYGWGNPGLALHELAHFLVSPSSRNRQPNYGMGRNPVVGESKWAKISKFFFDPGTMDSFAKIQIEEAASVHVNIWLAQTLLGTEHAERTRKGLSGGEDEPTPMISSLISKVKINKIHNMPQD